MSEPTFVSEWYSDLFFQKKPSSSYLVQVAQSLVLLLKYRCIDYRAVSLVVGVVRANPVDTAYRSANDIVQQLQIREQWHIDTLYNEVDIGFRNLISSNWHWLG